MMRAILTKYGRDRMQLTLDISANGESLGGNRRKIVGPEAICRMFTQAIAGASTLPHRLSSDHDPLFQYHHWKANLRIRR